MLYKSFQSGLCKGSSTPQWKGKVEGKPLPGDVPPLGYEPQLRRSRNMGLGGRGELQGAQVTQAVPGNPAPKPLPESKRDRCASALEPW